MDGQKFCLKWDGFQSSVTSVFDHLRQDEELVDITLCCEGQKVRAHRMMLSACSPYFRDLLKDNPCQQMVVFLRDTTVADLHAVIEFMYKGSVNVCQSQLASFIKTAEMLQIRGLSGEDEKSCAGPGAGRPPTAAESAPPPAKRRRRSVSPPPPPPAADSPAPALAEPPPPPPPPPPADCGSLLPPPAAAPADAVKVEKVDLTEEEEDATLGCVAEYEGGYAEPERPPAAGLRATGHSAGRPGPEHALGNGLLASGLSQPAGTSQPGCGMSQQAADSLVGIPQPLGELSAASRLASEDGLSQDGGTYVCPICGRQYTNPRSLEYHKKMHEGLTTCVLCGKVSSKVEHLRRHLENVHKLSQEDIRSIVPTRHRSRHSDGYVV